jgi:hypothetical protein
VRRYEIVVIYPEDVATLDWTSPEYFDAGDELAVGGRVAIVYRVERLPGGRERLICLPPSPDDPRACVAA